MSTDVDTSPLSATAPEALGRSALTVGEAEVISLFVQMTQALGLPRSLGEIYGLLFASPQPLALQDIVDRLQLSKGSVSQGLRFLREIGAIQPCSVVGDRRGCFAPVVELRTLVGGFIRERINPQLAGWSERARRLDLQDFPASVSALATPEDLKILQDRLDKLKNWHQRADLILPILSKLLG
jgi:HTH-type transcriptional regulator, glycine betaine synthesis regulator